MWAELKDADDDALVYFAHILPCLAPCSLTLVHISIMNRWSASSQTWEMVDDAILQLSQGTVSRVLLIVHSDADNIPAWEMLPYDCVDQASKHMLPKCAAAGLIVQCNGKQCLLHSPQRWHLQTEGTLAELLNVLPTWTCPVENWDITSHTALQKRFGDLSQAIQRVWDEISRVFALSIAARPHPYIGFYAEGLGKLVLHIVSSACLQICFTAC